MTLQDILQEAKALSVIERRELIKSLVDTLAADAHNSEISSQQPRRPRNLVELAGLGAEIWKGIDAQDYVNQLRSEWDDRP